MFPAVELHLFSFDELFVWAINQSIIFQFSSSLAGKFQLFHHTVLRTCKNKVLSYYNIELIKLLRNAEDGLISKSVSLWSFPQIDFRIYVTGVLNKRVRRNVFEIRRNFFLLTKAELL